MAFGIDDVVSALTGGMRITTTLVKTIERYKKEKKDYDLDMLIEEVRVTALGRIDDLDLALGKFEMMMREQKVDLDRNITDIMAEIPFWKPFQQHRLSQIHKTFSHFIDSIYSACDDIAALVRCQGRMQEMGIAVVESARAKHELLEKILDADSLKTSLDILRGQLTAHKVALSS